MVDVFLGRRALHAGLLDPPLELFGHAPAVEMGTCGGYDAFGACDLLRSDEEAGQEIRRFEREAAKSGFTLDADELTTGRLRLAFIRVFDPIAGDQGVVERHYEELRHTGELGKYLEFAFDREPVLLRREPDLKQCSGMGRAVARGETAFRKNRSVRQLASLVEWGDLNDNS